MRSFICISLGFILALGNVNAQTDEMSCEYGTNQAIEDLNNGTMKQLLFGPGEDVFLTLVLKSDYGIEVKAIGCSVTEADQCYNAKMNEIIYEKYGTDIYEKAKAKAKRMAAEIWTNEK